MPEDAFELVVARLDIAPAELRVAAALLSEDEDLRAGRFLLAQERRRFTAARAGLRRLLGARLGASPGSIEFTCGRRGKPALAGAFAGSGLRFNVSHHGETVAYAFSDGSDIGVDIEAVRELPDADEIASCAFSPRERATYFALEARDRPRAFFDCWTRKEAFVKALGDGLGHGLHGFDVSLAPDEPARILRVGGLPGERCGWTLHAFAPAPGMTGAVVVRRSLARAARDALQPAPVLHDVMEQTHERAAA